MTNQLEKEKAPTILKEATGISTEKRKFSPKFEPAPVKVEESFPKGIVFLKAEIAYRFDKEANKATDEPEGIRITCLDQYSKKQFSVKLPLEAELPNGLEDYEYGKCTFVGMTGGRMGFDYFFNAQGIEFL